MHFMRRFKLFIIFSFAIIIATAVLLDIYVFGNKSNSDIEETPKVVERHKVGEGDSNSKKDQDKEKDSEKKNNSTDDKDKDKDKKETDKNKMEDKNEDNDKSSAGDKDKDADKDKDSEKIYWGVDSATYTTKDSYSCVIDNFGEPKIWGRYLGEIEDVSQGLDKDEVTFLHDKDISILVIYNHFDQATGNDHGVDHAKKAITYAKDLDIPEGVAIFADIEPEFAVDSAFIEGWHDTLQDSKYKPGVYGVFDESALLEAFNATEKNTKKNTIVWSAYPQKEVTTKEKAPKFAPAGPDEAMLYGWQYAIDAETCNIDTNLFKGEILDYLW